MGDAATVNFSFALCGRAYAADDPTQLDDAASTHVTYTHGTTYLNGTTVAAGATGILDDSSLMVDNTSADSSYLRLDIGWLLDFCPDDFRIEYSDAVTHVAQRYGQVGRDGRFADSSLAGGNCEDVPYASRGGYFLFYGRCRSLFLFRNGYLAGQFGECFGHCRCYLPFDGVGERVAPFAEGEGDDCILSVGRDMLDDTR